MSPSVARSPDHIEITRWPSERPLFVLALALSIVLWVLAVISVVGLIYAAMFGILFFMMHLAFVAYVRGSAVRLGPDQFPELHIAVERLAARVGVEPAPEAYLMQAGGALNALATRFLRRHMVVLFSDLLEACGDNTGARDMIIAHELGHVRAGHLKWHWVLMPASLIPFLGSALSRAREYTCDRYGRAGAGSTDQALLGLAILSAGAKHGPLVNRRAFVAQRAALNTGWMTLGTWLASHPPLSHRMVALDPALAAGPRLRPVGALRAAALVAIVVLPLVLVGWVGASKFTGIIKEAQSKAVQDAGSRRQPVMHDTDGAPATEPEETSVPTGTPGSE